MNPLADTEPFAGRGVGVGWFWLWPRNDGFDVSLIYHRISLGPVDAWTRSWENHR